MFGWFQSRPQPSEPVAAEPLAPTYLDQVQAEVTALIGKTSLPCYDPAPFNYSPVGDEKLLHVLEGVQRLEVKSTGRYVRTGLGGSIRIMRGVSWRWATPTIRAEKEQRVTATGQLIVTDKAVVFEGDNKNERLTWRQIADVELLADGVKITKRTGPPRIYEFTVLDPRFTAVLYVMSAARQP